MSIAAISAWQLKPEPASNPPTMGIDIISSGATPVFLQPGESKQVNLQCPDRGRDRALGVDIVSQEPIIIDVLKDSIWFVTVQNASNKTNQASFELWCKKGI